MLTVSIVTYKSAEIKAMPSWLNYALLSAVILGAVNIIDAHILYKRILELRRFVLRFDGSFAIWCFDVHSQLPLKNPGITRPIPLPNARTQRRDEPH